MRQHGLGKALPLLSHKQCHYVSTYLRAMDKQKAIDGPLSLKVPVLGGKKPINSSLSLEGQLLRDNATLCSNKGRLTPR